MNGRTTTHQKQGRMDGSSTQEVNNQEIEWMECEER